MPAGPQRRGEDHVREDVQHAAHPTKGQVLVDGVDAVRSPAAARRRLGLMLGGELGFYARASVLDNLRFFADVAGVGRDRDRVVGRALRVVGLGDVPRRKVAHLSRGMRQRLHLARAIVAQPPLLILDEPSTGLDPEIAVEMRRLVQALANDGAGVLLTTHPMSEAEALANRIVVVGAGRVAVDGTVADVARAADIGLVTHCSLPIPHDEFELDRELVLTVGKEQQGETYRCTICWRSGATRDEVDRALAALPETAFDLITRPALLEEAYLALASRLVRVPA